MNPAPDSPEALGAALQRYTPSPGAYARGHNVELIRTDAKYFDRLAAEIDAARYFVHVEMYNFASDSTGFVVAQALARAARRGLWVRVLYDAVGTASLESGVFEYLEQHGAQVRAYREPRFFRPVAAQRSRRTWPWSPVWNRRDHRKIIICDEGFAAVSGANIAVEYAGDTHTQPWLDYAALVSGPVVQACNRLFSHVWLGGRAPTPGDGPFLTRPLVRRDGRLWLGRPASRVTTGHAVSLDAVGSGLPRSAVVVSYRFAIAAAQKSVYLWNAYFLPSRRLRAALSKAVRRGVDVRVILPAKSDVALVELATGRRLAGLLRAGVRVYAYEPAMMHAKVALIDETWLTVGSANLDPRSRFHNAEANLNLVDEALGAWLGARFREDLEQCTELRLAEWRRRPWWRKTAEWAAYQLRYWL